MRRWLTSSSDWQKDRVRRRTARAGQEDDDRQRSAGMVCGWSDGAIPGPAQGIPVGCHTGDLRDSKERAGLLRSICQRACGILSRGTSGGVARKLKHDDVCRGSGGDGKGSSRFSAISKGPAAAACKTWRRVFVRGLMRRKWCLTLA